MVVKNTQFKILSGPECDVCKLFIECCWVHVHVDRADLYESLGIVIFMKFVIWFEINC